MRNHGRAVWWVLVFVVALMGMAGMAANAGRAGQRHQRNPFIIKDTFANGGTAADYQIEDAFRYVVVFYYITKNILYGNSG